MSKGLYNRTRSRIGLRYRRNISSYECTKCAGKQFRIIQSVSYVIDLDADKAYFEGQKPPRARCIACGQTNKFSILDKHPILDKLYTLVQQITSNALGQDFKVQSSTHKDTSKAEKNKRYSIVEDPPKPLPGEKDSNGEDPEDPEIIDMEEIREGEFSALAEI